MSALPAELLSIIARDFPDGFSTDDPEDLLEHGSDWTKVFAPAPALVVRPHTTAEVSRFVRACHDHSVAIVPSGGRTGLAGGAVAANGEVVVSLSRMRTMHPVDTVGQTVRVEAGAVTQAVHDHCEPHGLTWPVDFASKGSSQVGGNIATNAGGVRVIRYGLTRQWVLGLTVVTGTGEVLELGGALEKNNTGVDLRQLFIGSEGILGIITEATLKLERIATGTKVLLFAVEGLEGVLRLFREARRGPFSIGAYEFFTDKCLARLQRHRHIGDPLDGAASHYALLEVEGVGEDTLMKWLEGVLDGGLVVDGTLALDGHRARHLWELREGISESLSSTGLPHKNDVALPIASLTAFCEDLQTVFEEHYPEFEICLFGHIGDGNLHVNVMKPDDMDKDAFLEKTHACDRHLFELVQKHHGSISAEHGIGLLKKEFLGYTRSEGEIALMRQLKSVFDPKGILNPGKVI